MLGLEGCLWYGMLRHGNGCRQRCAQPPPSCQYPLPSRYRPSHLNTILQGFQVGLQMPSIPCRQLEGQRTEIEAALHQRASATQSALASLLDTVHQLQAHTSAPASSTPLTPEGQQAAGDGDAAARRTSGGGADSVGAGSEGVASEVAGAATGVGAGAGAEQVAALRRALSGGHAAQRAAQEQLALAEDRWTEAEERIKKLQVRGRRSEVAGVQEYRVVGCWVKH